MGLYTFVGLSAENVGGMVKISHSDFLLKTPEKLSKLGVLLWLHRTIHR